MQKIKFYIVLALAVIISTLHGQSSSSVLKLMTKVDNFTAGDTITLKFQGTSGSFPPLYCSNSYGSTLVSGLDEGEFTVYNIPSFISSKSGLVQWTLQNEKQGLSGTFIIQPQSVAQNMETYLGPPSIQSGNKDYSMMVTIPTDTLDNPLRDSIAVKMSRQFKQTEATETVFSTHLIAYNKIYAPSESGRILLSSSHQNTTSKEFTLTVYPANPNDFEIVASRPHDYADGNQITTFKSSIIKDANGNIVSDGTYVEFIITTNEGALLKTTGTTINGEAITYMIHPDKASEWRVNALIEGMAESNEISLVYKQSIQPFETNLTENNRKITVGPIKSFMNQLVPDGLEVKIELYSNQNIIYTDRKTSEDGEVYFIIKPDIVPSGSYTIRVSAAGLTSDIKNVALW